MNKMWAGRFKKQLNPIADDFNSSIHVDCRMYKQDIKGSMAHAAMLSATGILKPEEAEKIIDGLDGILKDLQSEELKIDPSAEDIHMFVEGELTKRIGDCGKKLHTARSRNDQVALDIRMYLKDEAAELSALLKELIAAIRDKAVLHKSAIMPGYTHLQRAQPITFLHHLLCWCMMLCRDLGRLEDTVKRMNYSPLGSCALAGTTFATDREAVAKELGFDGITLNSIDGVSDRDFCLEMISTLSIVMMHLSRMSEELILWSSWEFKFVEMDDSYTTGSSIMPQKKNPDMAELIRGKTGRVYGDLMALLTVLKGLPLAYNKDMQEDKEAVFDAVETVKMCLKVMAPMIATMTVREDKMLAAAKEGFINATDLADYLTKRGVPFRTAYKTVGEIVALCIEKGTVLDELPIDEYKKLNPLFSNDLYNEISLEACVKKRISAGGTGPQSVAAQLDFIESALKQ